MSVFTNPAATSAEDAKAYTQAVLGLLLNQDPFEVLRATEAALQRALDGFSGAEVAQPEAPGKWSARHVVQHLADAEVVWSWRLRLVLAQDRPTLTGYDQDAWAKELHYELSDPDQAVRDFGTLRRANLRLLERASADDLKRVGVHAERGEESVGHLMKLYAGHDLLHLRQLDRIGRAVRAAGTRP